MIYKISLNNIINMYINILLTVAPRTITWSPQVALIMIVCNFLTIIIGRYAIEVRGLGPGIPGFEGFGLPELLATTSLGHITGAAAIIGLSSIGVLN